MKARRNRPGTKAEDLWHWSLEDFSKMTGPFAVQEYIQELIRSDPANVQKICEPPPDVDLAVWQYEHLRQFILELNLLVVQLQNSCTPQTCPKMKATDDFIYLCASHRNPQECSAIDYMVHTLDHASSILHSPNNFSSRVAVQSSSIKFMVSIFRRVYRLFSHTYYNHRDVFLEFEREMHLCGRFTELVQRFDMMPTRLFNIPMHALQG